jgi:hypothetical protein
LNSSDIETGNKCALVVSITKHDFVNYDRMRLWLLDSLFDDAVSRAEDIVVE